MTSFQAARRHRRHHRCRLRDRLHRQHPQHRIRVLQQPAHYRPAAHATATPAGMSASRLAIHRRVMDSADGARCLRRPDPRRMAVRRDHHLAPGRVLSHQAERVDRARLRAANQAHRRQGRPPRWIRVLMMAQRTDRAKTPRWPRARRCVVWADLSVRREGGAYHRRWWDPRP